MSVRTWPSSASLTNGSLSSTGKFARTQADVETWPFSMSATGRMGSWTPRVETFEFTAEDIGRIQLVASSPPLLREAI